MIVGKNFKKTGIPPSIILIRPKYPRNVGQAVRAASCFRIPQVWFTGDRVSLDVGKKERLPREERMKGYSKVDLIQFDYPLDQFKDCTPVAIEVRPNSEILTTFDHPKNPVYIFGPEDGAIPKQILRLCHRFVIIPTSHCTNLAAAVYIVLYDRLMKRHLSGEETIPRPEDVLEEPRHWTTFEDTTGEDYKQGEQKLEDILS